MKETMRLRMTIMTTNKRRQTKKNWKGKSGLTTIIAFIAVALIFLLSPPEDEADKVSNTGFIPVDLVKTINGLSL